MGKGGTIKPSHPFPQTLETAKNGASHITHREDDDEQKNDLYCHF